jgi:hypothetical protein
MISTISSLSIAHSLISLSSDDSDPALAFFAGRLAGDRLTGDRLTFFFFVTALFALVSRCC